MGLGDRVRKARAGAGSLLVSGADTLLHTARSRNYKLLLSLAGPALRGFILDRGGGESAMLDSDSRTWLSWDYTQTDPQLMRLYRAAKRGQWDAEQAINWNIDVDPMNERKPILIDGILPLRELRTYRRLDKREKQIQRHAMASWLLSQFLHGEQGALLASCQVTEASDHMDAKLFGSTQVVDEGRHVEVFYRYLTEKLEKAYPINQNLYVILDALLTDERWDIKFLGMQIMVEGLALGAFSTIRANTREPLLKKLLQFVIKDEARHVHYGVVSLSHYYSDVISETERREREDWAFEIARHMRNRFLAHEFYDEFYSHLMSRSTWDKLMLDSEFMNFFRRTMFRRVIPNLRRINLLSPRIRRHYGELGMLVYENEKSADELTMRELLAAEKPKPRKVGKKTKRKKKKSKKT